MFPGGKQPCNETCIDCAARETYEETGLDVARLLSNTHSIRIPAITRKSKNGLTDTIQCTVFIARGVDTALPTHPRSAEEIRECRWVPVGQIAGRTRIGMMSDALKKSRSLMMAWINAHREKN